MSVRTSEPIGRQELSKRLADAVWRLNLKSMEIERLRADRHWLLALGLSVGFAVGALLMDMLGCAS